MKRAFLVFILFLSSICFAKYVELGDVFVTYEINKYGKVHVTEEITFLLEDCDDDPFREVYSERPPGLIIENPNGYCTNTKCNFRYDTYDKSISGSNELVLELTNKRCGEIKTKFDYDVYPIVIAKDTTQFFYKIWGETSPSANINVKLVLPGEIFYEIMEYEYKEVEVKVEETGEIRKITTQELVKNETGKRIIYFLHKEDEDYETREYGNILEIISYQKQREMLEINLLMPNDWFVENNNFIYRKDLSKNEIIEVEERDMLYRSYKKIIDMILTFMFFVYLLIPFIIIVIIYFMYGKELTRKEVNYSGIYERELPSKHNPAEAIFFIKGDEEYSQKERVNAIISTIMSFVNKGIAEIEEKNNDVYLSFNYEKIEKIKLESYEHSLINYIKKYFGNKKFSLKEFEKKCSGKLDYYQFVERFFMSINNINWKSIYVENHGNKIAGISLGLYFILNFFVMFIEPFAFFGFVFTAIAFFIIKYKKIMLAKWTRDGRILNLKWENFRKYISDYSLMKEHPPESVKIWDEYLTYAIALGVANKTIKIMKRISPKDIEVNNHSIAHVYLTSTIALQMNKSFSPTYVSRSSSSGSMGGYSGSNGGFGGGMGGGGFGGR